MTHWQVPDIECIVMLAQPWTQGSIATLISKPGLIKKRDAKTRSNRLLLVCISTLNLEPGVKRKWGAKTRSNRLLLVCFSPCLVDRKRNIFKKNHKNDTKVTRREANEKQTRSKREAKWLKDVSNKTFISDIQWHDGDTKVTETWHDEKQTRSKREANRPTLEPKPYSSGFIKPQLNPS